MDMDTFTYSFVACLIMLLVGQPIIAGVCLIVGLLAPSPRKSSWFKKWKRRNGRI